MELLECSHGAESVEKNHAKELLHNDNDARKIVQGRKASGTQGFKT